MNFISTFDELNKLYEEAEVEPKRTLENFDNESGASAWNKKAVIYYTQAAKELGLTDFTMKAVSIGGGKQKAILTAKKNGKQLSTEADYLDTIEDISSAADAKEFLEYVFGGLQENFDNEQGSKAWNNTVIGYYTQAAKELGLTDFDMKAVSVGGGKQKAIISATHNGEQMSEEEIAMENTYVDIKSVEDAKDYLRYIFALSESVESDDAEMLTEEAEDEEIEIVDDEESRQVIMECSKCGALVIKDEADVVAAEEPDLVNVEEECAFCEESEGYKIIGVLAPYEVAEVEDEVIEEPVDVEESEVAEEEEFV